MLYEGVTAKVYQEGDVIVRQGEVGESMYVIASGRVEVLVKKGRKQVRLAILGPRDFFGEMAIFDSETRSATVRAMGQLEVFAIEKQTFKKIIRQMPWLAFRVLEKMSRRIREDDREFVKLRKALEKLRAQ